MNRPTAALSSCAPRCRSRGHWLALLVIAGVAGIAGVAAPAAGDVYPSSSRGSYWLVVTDQSDPRTLDREGYVRDNLFASANRFWAANSGGRVQHDLLDVLYAPIQINADGTRPSNWRSRVNSYVESTYGVDLSGKLRIYDVAFTKPSPGQTWAGQAVVGGNWMALQNRAYGVYAHELGHIYGLGHSSGFRKGGGSMYVWDEDSGRYIPYTNDNAKGPHTPMPFGIAKSEYGHSNSIMGAHGNGHVPTSMKRSRSWLFNRTNEILSYEEARLWEDQTNTLRIFAHNDLQDVVDDSDPLPRYGVTQGYNQNLTYSFEYQRVVKRYGLQADDWLDVTQKVMMEYWFDQDNPGLHVYIDPNANDGVNEYVQVDVNTFGGWQLNPKVDTTLTDLELGTSFFLGNGDNFINDGPSAPLPPTDILSEYFAFELLGQGVVNDRNYMDVKLSLITVPDPGTVALPVFAGLALLRRRRAPIM